jgi:hypothetical protein
MSAEIKCHELIDHTIMRIVRTQGDVKPYSFWRRSNDNYGQVDTSGSSAHRYK